MDENQIQVIEPLNPNNYLGATIIESDNRYIAFSDGTLIQRGRGWKPSGLGYSDVSFPKPFKDTDYEITVTPLYYYQPYVSFSISDTTANGFRAWLSPNEECYFTYIAMGRWK